jgi:hypothetical protein
MAGSNRYRRGRSRSAGRTEIKPDYTCANVIARKSHHALPLIEASPASYRGGYEGGPYKRFNSCRFESLLVVLLELPGGGP